MWIRRVGGGVRAVAYAPDGRTVYTCEGGRVSAWDIASREPARLFRTDQLAHPTYGNELFPVGDRYLLLGGYASRSVWDMENQKELTNIDIGGWCRPVRSSSSAVRFVSKNGKTIRECDLATGKTAIVLRAPDDIKRMSMFVYSPDEKYALVLDDRGAARGSRSRPARRFP